MENSIKKTTATTKVSPGPTHIPQYYCNKHSDLEYQVRYTDKLLVMNSQPSIYCIKLGPNDNNLLPKE